MSVSPVMEVPTDEPFTEEQACFYFRDVVLGIEYCEFGFNYKSLVESQNISLIQNLRFVKLVSLTVHFFNEQLAWKDLEINALLSKTLINEKKD